ncbi:MAG: cytidine deaminase [Clostridiales bacterium]|nr:MAG: cytidine deaminase [Clostridiales bacterium]
MIEIPLTDSDHILISLASEIIKNNYDDKTYRHTVGAAVRCKNGRIYKGVNCDGIHGSCAEYIAIGSAITAGEREFDTVVAVFGCGKTVIPPCGNCRQMLLDYAPDCNVILNNEEGELVKVSVKDLLPLAYVCTND